MEIIKNKLKYMTLSLSDRHHYENTFIFNEVYAFWKNIFASTFKQVIQPDYILYSDDFLLQDKIGVLQMDQNIVGVIAISELNTSLQMNFDKSYFKHYPPDVLLKIKNDYKKIFIISNLAIAPKYRKTNGNNSFSTHLIGLAIMSFLQSESEALITITRNNRGTDKIVSMYGGVSLAQHNVHNISSDILVIEKPRGLEVFGQLNDSIVSELKNLFNPIYTIHNKQGEMYENTSSVN